MVRLEKENQILKSRLSGPSDQNIEEVGTCPYLCVLLIMCSIVLRMYISVVCNMRVYTCVVMCVQRCVSVAGESACQPQLSNVQSNLLSILKGRPNLYFLPEVHTISTD